MLRFRSRFRVLPFLLLSGVAGCSDEPKAPPLVREAVYQNDGIGLRFLAPTGWVLTTRSNPPAGSLAVPVLLVNYVQTRGERPAELAVVLADLPADADVGRFLADYRFGADVWQLTDKNEPATINGTPGTQYLLKRTAKGENYRREATVVRRGGRVVVFYLTYGARDPDNRDVGRKSLESAAWMD